MSLEVDFDIRTLIPRVLCSLCFDVHLRTRALSFLLLLPCLLFHVMPPYLSSGTMSKTKSPASCLGFSVLSQWQKCNQYRRRHAEDPAACHARSRVLSEFYNPNFFFKDLF